MKKILLTLVLVVTVVLPLTSCGSTEYGFLDNEDSSVSQSSPLDPQPAAPVESGSQAQEDTVMTLTSWLETDDAKQAESDSNSAMRSFGMTFKLDVDGNTLIYEYHLDTTIDQSSRDRFEEAFNSIIEANKASLDDLLHSFDTLYDIKPDGVRFVFFDAEDSELYTGEVVND